MSPRKPGTKTIAVDSGFYDRVRAAAARSTIRNGRFISVRAWVQAACSKKLRISEGILSEQQPATRQRNPT